ncbi:hypothetical protein HDU93_009077 [Gonapodya sp. JEL0774]|nr:hypothetical protein HDU93_009077 [Gonapodya sp. JEL0774]
MEASDRALIDAIETSNLTLVKKALAEGADPNARKKITLVCDVRSGRRPLGKVKVRTSLLRGEVYEERFENTYETRTDTVPGESVLALAIFTGHLDIIAALIEMGASVNAPIEWPNANTVPAWSPDRWNDTRWVRTYRAESALHLAVGRAIRVLDYDGTASAWNTLAEKGKLRVNKMGGEVRLVNPESWEQAYRELDMLPRLKVIALLLRHGAKVTIDVWEAARRTENQGVMDLLEPYAIELGLENFSSPNSTLWKKASTRHASGSNISVSRTSVDSTNPPGSTTDTLVNGDVALSRLLVDQMRQTEELRRELRTMQSVMAEREAHFSALELRAAELEERNAELERELAFAKTEVENLTDRLTALGESFEGSGRRRDIKKMMYVTTPYVPRERDELALELGQTVFVNWDYDDGWAAGLNTVTGASGIFPLACVSLNAGSVSPLSSDSLSRRVSSTTLKPVPPPSSPVPSSPPPPPSDFFSSIFAMHAAAEAKVGGSGSTIPTSPSALARLGGRSAGGSDGPRGVSFASDGREDDSFKREAKLRGSDVAP